MTITVKIPDSESGEVMAVGAEDFRKFFFPRLGLHPTSVKLAHITHEENKKRMKGVAYKCFSDESP